MKKKLLASVLISFLSLTPVANALVINGGDVKFTAVGTLGYPKIKGSSKSEAPRGSVTMTKKGADAEFSFALQSLDTGIDLRNEHMKEKYLEVSKYPIATLKITDLDIKSDELSTDHKRPFKGALTLHGVTKEVRGEYQFTASSRTVKSNFTILVSDFKIDIPKYMGVTVSEKVEIEVVMKLSEK